MMLIINAIFCGAVFYMAFCRLAITTSNVKWQVRWAVSALGTAAFGMALIPLVRPDDVGYMRVIFAASIAAYLYTTSPIWLEGIPRSLCVDRERRKGVKDRRAA